MTLEIRKNYKKIKSGMRQGRAPILSSKNLTLEKTVKYYTGAVIKVF